MSLMIGANDYFLCQEETPDQCRSESEQDALLATLKHNLTKMLGSIRQIYHGQLVLVDSYSPSPSLDGLTEVSDAFENRVAARYHVQVADGYGAFQQAEATAGTPDDPCAAGLLTVLSSGGCGIHPSPNGQAMLAHALEHVVQTAPQQ